MSTLILALCSSFRDRESDCGARTHSKLLRLAGKVYTSTLELEESAQFALASWLQFRALEVEGILESAFASSAIASRRTRLSLALESILKGQDTLYHALENGLLSPEHFLELNMEWGCLSRGVRRYERRLL
jgi:hypothetical protein